MAINFPYALSFLTDILDINMSQMHLRRFDEMSGTADGRFWSAELASPLWEADVKLISIHWDEARRVNARIRALAGSGGEFLWTDPSFEPEFDAGGPVTISAISADRTAVTLAGLRPLHGVRSGDMLSINHSDDRIYLGEFSEDSMAEVNGILPMISIMPYLPMNIGVGAVVELNMPVVKMFIDKDGFTPYSFEGGKLAGGASIKMLQRP